MEDTCLYDLFSRYDYRKTKCCKSDKCAQLNKQLGWLHERKTPKILKTEYFPPSKQNRELICHQALLLFKPWRIEHTDLRGEHQTYEESYHANEQTLNEMHSKFTDGRQRLQRTREVAAYLNEQVDVGVGPEEMDTDEQCALSASQTATQQVKTPATAAMVNHYENNLNVEQRQVYDRVLKSAARGDPRSEQILTFTSGEGGSGKSYGINANNLPS